GSASARSGYRRDPRCSGWARRAVDWQTFCRGVSLAATVAAIDLSLFFLGTGGAVPSARRGLPAVLLSRGGDRLLFDCGEGTQRQLVRSVGLIDVDRVFLTHFHADHWLGLPGMMKTF